MKTILFAALLALLPVLAHAQSMKVTWQDNSTNELGFALERCQGAGCADFKEIARTGANVTEALDATVAEGLTYCYRVRAFNNDAAGKEQRSAYTNISCATVKVPAPDPIPIPDAPSGLEAVEVQATSLILRWQATDNAAVAATGTYTGDRNDDRNIIISATSAAAVVQQIEINDHPQGREERFRLLTAVPAETREWKIAGLSRNSPYYFRMRNCAAVDSLCSAYSNVAAVKTPR